MQPTPELILIVNDNEAGRYATNRILTRAGFQTLEASTGEACLRLARSASPQLVVLDINLPDIDGYEVARRLRTSSKRALMSVPIIAVTANALKGDAEKALDAGCDVYMSKPINIRELWARVEAFVPMP